MTQPWPPNWKVHNAANSFQSLGCNMYRFCRTFHVSTEQFICVKINGFHMRLSRKRMPFFFKCTQWNYSLCEIRHENRHCLIHWHCVHTHVHNLSMCNDWYAVTNFYAEFQRHFCDAVLIWHACLRCYIELLFPKKMVLIEWIFLVLKRFQHESHNPINRWSQVAIIHLDLRSKYSHTVDAD